MGKFQHKLYRCEWQVQYWECGQYGERLNCYERFPFATQQEALDALPTLATKQVNWSWRPNNAPHSYTVAIIDYKEVFIRNVEENI
jgi:hypothetical protein